MRRVGEVELVSGVVLPRQQGADRPRLHVLGDDRDVGGKRSRRVVREGERAGGVGRGLRVRLPLRVERGGDLESALVEAPLACVHGLAEGVERAVGVREDLPDQIGHEVRLRGSAVDAGVLREVERRRLRLLTPVVGQDPLPDHAVQHVVATDPRLQWVPDRVVQARVADDPRERGALREREPGGGHPEVVLGGGADPVDAVGQVHLVEVHLQDLVLRVLLLDADRQRELLQLAFEAPVVGIEPQGVLHELLGDGRGPFDDLPGAGVRDHRPQQGGPVEGAVAVEVRVLDGQDRLPRNGADLVEMHDLPVVEVDRGEDGLAVVGVDRRTLGEARDLGEVGAQRRHLVVDPLDAHRGAHERGGDHHGHEARGDQHDGDQQQDRERFERQSVVERAGVRPARSGRHAHGVAPRIPLVPPVR